jgi:hypothetical protein
MFLDEKFTEADTLPAGSMIMVIPGAKMQIMYDKGKSYVNANGSIGYVALQVSDITAEEVQDAGLLTGIVGAMMVQVLNDLTMKPDVLKAVQKNPLSLFYSQTVTGNDVLTIGGSTETDAIQKDKKTKRIIATYSTSEGTPSVEEVYALHLKAAANQILFEDQKTIREKAGDLVNITNAIYDESLSKLRAFSKQTGL